MFKTLKKSFTYIMQTPPVVRITQFLNLLTAILWQFYENQEPIDKSTFEKFVVYCIVWAIGGLFESEEREKFHKLLESKQMPLPSISAQRMSVEKETVFDYYVDPSTKQWKIWEPTPW